MNNIIKIALVTSLILTTSFLVNAQIAINSDGAAPDASAMLDIASTDKGILVPRMDSTSRNNIASPATGLLVFDTDNNSFWYYANAAWSEIGGSGAFTSENGITTSANNSDDFVFGADDLNNDGSTEAKFFFDQSKGAFRAGHISDNSWDESNLGNYSTAFGYDTEADGNYSMAFGYDTEADGNYSMASGYYTVADGDYSMASGYYTWAEGKYSTAFGHNSHAEGDYSFVTGKSTLAEGNYSIALGYLTEAASFSELAIGIYNTTYTSNSATSFDNEDRLFVIGNGISSANRSDAMIVYKNGNTEINGQLTISDTLTIDSALIVNGNFIANNTAFTSENGITVSTNNSDDFLFGADNLDNGGSSEYKFFFDKSKGAFRAGGINNDSWDENNLGNYSAAFGYNTTASGNYSTVFGYNAEASGNYSMAIGYYAEAEGNHSIALGNTTYSGGDYSFAAGVDAYSFGDYSFALGNNTQASSFSETAIGIYSTTYTPNSSSSFDNEDRLFVIGNGTNSSNRSDAMIVYKNGNTEINGNLIANNTAFTSENGITVSNNHDDDFVFGADSINQESSTAEYKMFFDKSEGAFRAGQADVNRWDESNIGKFSFSGGEATEASGYASVALGYRVNASGDYSVALGYSTASGQYSSSFGLSTASGQYSTAFGQSTASADYSTSFGEGIASAYHSTAFGEGTEAESYGEFVIGILNTSYTPSSTSSFNNSDRLFVIGNGTSLSSRSDAMIVYKSGNTEINGQLTISDTLTIEEALVVNGNTEINGQLTISDTLTIEDALVVNGNLIANNTAFTSENGITTSSNNSDDFVFGADNLNNGGSSEYKFFFDQSKGAFRAGEIDYDLWDETNLGVASSAFGYDTKASGKYSTALGNNTQALSYGEVAIGLFNTYYSENDNEAFDSEDRLFVIGNGTNALNTSDAMVVYKNGNTEINGALTINNKYTFPLTNGNANNILQTDGSGTLSWSTLAALADADDDTQIQLEKNPDENIIRFDLGGVEYFRLEKGRIEPNNTGSSILIGEDAGVNDDFSGNQSIYLGTRAGYSNIIGEGNIFIGHEAGYNETNSNKLYIDNSNSGSPLIYGEFDNNLLEFNGSVGIGTTPTKATFEVSGSSTNSSNYSYGYLNSAGSTGTTSGTYNYSIYASSRIAGSAFHAISDERIKNIQGISNSKNDLNTLMNIKITDYTMKDSISHGNQAIKKVIAQQVRGVYPQAVTNSTTEVIPNIYKTATIDKNGWVSISTDLKKGDKVQIIFDDKKEILEVLETKENAFRVKSATGKSSVTAFIYGKQVDDFHTVDYEAISMLNVSATQELAKENEQLKIQNKKQQAEINELKIEVAKINQLEAMLQQLQAQLQTNSTTKTETEK